MSLKYNFKKIALKHSDSELASICSAHLFSCKILKMIKTNILRNLPDKGEMDSKDFCNVFLLVFFVCVLKMDTSKSLIIYFP